MDQLQLIAPEGWRDYELLDSGAGRRLERFGEYVFDRPEPQALWRQALPPQRWQAADATFQGASKEEEGGRWQMRRPLPERWQLRYRAMPFWARPTSFRHLGVFPEQAAQWDWMTERIEAAGRELHVLNLFGYTGLASLLAARAGARVTHVDASKKAIGWARENQELAGLNDKSVRWVVEDALKYIGREERRGVRYDGLLLDPPKFGRGPRGEVWKLEESLPELLASCAAILSERPVFVILTAYAIRVSALSMRYALADALAQQGGTVEAGEMALHEGSAGRLLPTSIYARWSG